MKITTDVDLAPNVQKYLPIFSNAHLYNKQYGLKHPTALFNTSYAKIIDSLDDFFKIYNNFNSSTFEDTDKKYSADLLKKYRIFLYSLREYMDDCFSIIKCTEPVPINEKKDRNQFLWIRKNGGNLSNTSLDQIKDYKEYLDEIVNELKHNNGVLCGISFWNSVNPSEHCMGYYVANVFKERYQPVEKIHHTWNTMSTGFSFRRDIFFNIYNVFYLSELISELLRNKDSNIVKSQPVVAPPPQRIIDIFESMMLMPRYFFPDEYEKAIPTLSFIKGNKLKLEYPSALSIKPNRLDRVVSSLTGDGHTREFKMLYM